tara:strand:+ start:319 stop:1380 length:1062 start_codon:yes stop_codon:yes gene_type:complete
MSVIKINEEQIKKDPFEFPSIDVYELAKLKLPETKDIVRPFIQEGSSMEIFGESGKGKTWFTIELMLSVSTGQKFMNKFDIINTLPVWYIDGEMKLDNIRTRIDGIFRRYPLGTTIPDDYFHITNPYLADDKILPKINYKETQLAILEKVKQISDATGKPVLIVFDNLSCLTDIKENEADQWVPMLDFYTQLKSMGHCIIHIHHSPKNSDAKTSRGTSRRMDALDTIIQLKTPHDYVQQDGAYYNIQFNKTRNFAGEYAEPFNCKIRFTGERGQQTVHWDVSGFEDQQVLAVLEDYCSTAPENSVRKTAQATNVSPSTVQNILKSSRENGLFQKIMKEKHGEKWEEKDKLKQI